MKRSGWSGTTAVLMAALLMWAALPATPARAADVGDDSTGAAVAVGLMAAVVVVYGLVAFHADVNRYTEAEKDAALARAAQLAEESPIVLQALTTPIGLDSPGAGTQTEIAGASVSVRLRF